jgi:hypothetical protein
MSDDDFRDEIGRLEERIEALTESIERCRKVSLAAKLIIAAGAIWIALVLLWVVPFIPATVVAAMAGVIGGTVLLGSNATTWKQTEAALRAAEAARAELIEGMELRVVGEQGRIVH